MARKRSVGIVRDVGVDPRYGQDSIQKLINVVMKCGKKSLARSIVYKAMDKLEHKAGGNREKTVQLFHKALHQVSPQIEVRPRRVGGSVYQIPREVPHRRGRALAFRWLATYARKRSEKTMGERLGNELLEALEGRGNAVRKKQDVHKMAESNRAFSHYSW